MDRIEAPEDLTETQRAAFHVALSGMASKMHERGARLSETQRAQCVSVAKGIAIGLPAGLATFTDQERADAMGAIGHPLPSVAGMTETQRSFAGAALAGRVDPNAPNPLGLTPDQIRALYGYGRARALRSELANVMQLAKGPVPVGVHAFQHADMCRSGAVKLVALIREQTDTPGPHGDGARFAIAQPAEK